MSTGLNSLHKILKDETRRKIVFLLNERESLSYTDLMNNLKIVNTGLFNYHLKVLDDLIIKDETGQYLLTEKGKLASRLLIEFSEQDAVLQARKKAGKIMDCTTRLNFAVAVAFIADILGLYRFCRSGARGNRFYLFYSMFLLFL
jgi:hypothetical protein